MTNGILLIHFSKAAKWKKEQMQAILNALPANSDFEIVNNQDSPEKVLFKVTSEEYPKNSLLEAHCWVLKETIEAYRAEIQYTVNNLH